MQTCSAHGKCRQSSSACSIMVSCMRIGSFRDEICTAALRRELFSLKAGKTTTGLYREQTVIAKNDVPDGIRFATASVTAGCACPSYTAQAAAIRPPVQLHIAGHKILLAVAFGCACHVRVSFSDPPSSDRRPSRSRCIPGHHCDQRWQRTHSGRRQSHEAVGLWHIGQAWAVYDLS